MADITHKQTHDLLKFTLQDIRRAFKKIALEKHPDKNPSDPQAHSVFVRINTAFEVLKDEETRKKYDAYGEAGLKDPHAGGQYQGWNYYNEVGRWSVQKQLLCLCFRVFVSRLVVLWT